MRIFAFSDEAARDLDGQIAAMKRNGLEGTEIRDVDGRNITSLTVKEAADVLRRLKDNGLSVWSVGSPIGKIPLDAGGFGAHLDLLRRTLEIARALECGNLRMFSFYLPKGVRPEDCRNEVIDRLGKMAEAAEGSGVALCHENEKEIYGDIAARCADLLDAVSSLRCVFDPANFIQSGQDVPEAWALLGRRVYYMHIKDALPDGTVVPAGRASVICRSSCAIMRQGAGMWSLWNRICGCLTGWPPWSGICAPPWRRAPTRQPAPPLTRHAER